MVRENSTLAPDIIKEGMVRENSTLAPDIIKVYYSTHG
jgi:hypothetical protein